MNFSNPEEIRDMIISYIDSVPGSTRDSYGLMLPKMRHFLTLTLPTITVISGKVILDLITYGTRSATIELDENIITFRDYTYIIPPYYECSMHLSPHAAASSALLAPQ